MNKRTKRIYDFVVSKGTAGATLNEIEKELKLEKNFRRSMKSLYSETKLVPTVLKRGGTDKNDSRIIDSRLMFQLTLEVLHETNPEIFEEEKEEENA